tara:strand:+ start:416 stop:985 length:570 start_codon:yes stop_codon:yes gene_type:complete
MSTFYASRTNPNLDLNDETFSTIDLYLGSQSGAIPLAGYSNINAGFTCVLANPIILDISHRYVIALIKKSYDVQNYTDRYYNFSIYCDILEYQYEFGMKTQILYQSYAHRFTTGSSSPQDINPAVGDVVQIAWKFLNPTQKVIKEISFWLIDDLGRPLSTPLPPEFSYPTLFNILIKKVNSHVVATTVL